jgi:uncharacterized membrane protein YjjP (DUF1212 family)
LITDYSFIGTVVFMIVTGFVCHLCFYLMLKGRRPVFTVAAFVLMVGYFAHSYLSSIFIYNSPFAVLGLLWIILLFNNFMRRKRGPATAGQPNDLSLPKPYCRVQPT